MDMKEFLEKNSVLKVSEVSDGEIFEFVSFHGFGESFGRFQLNATVLVNGKERTFYLTANQTRQLQKIFGGESELSFVGKSVTTEKRQIEIIDRDSGKPLKVEVLNFVSLAEKPDPRKRGDDVS